MLSDYRKSTHYVIDIETLGTKPGCPIMQIAVAMVEEAKIKKVFCTSVSIEQCASYGLDKIDLSTVSWWILEHPRVFSAVFSNSAKSDNHPNLCLNELTTFCKRCNKEVFFWSKHPAFDFPILEKAYEIINSRMNLSLQVPWKYWEVRDIATLEDKRFLKSKPYKNLHDAKEDAIREAQTLIHAVWPEVYEDE